MYIYRVWTSSAHVTPPSAINPLGRKNTTLRTWIHTLSPCSDLHMTFICLAKCSLDADCLLDFWPTQGWRVDPFISMQQLYTQLFSYVWLPWQCFLAAVGIYTSQPRISPFVINFAVNDNKKESFLTVFSVKELSQRQPIELSGYGISDLRLSSKSLISL